MSMFCGHGQQKIIKTNVVWHFQNTNKCALGRKCWDIDFTRMAWDSTFLITWRSRISKINKHDEGRRPIIHALALQAKQITINVTDATRAFETEHSLHSNPTQISPVSTIDSGINHRATKKTSNADIGPKRCKIWGVPSAASTHLPLCGRRCERCDGRIRFGSRANQVGIRPLGIPGPTGRIWRIGRVRAATARMPTDGKTYKMSHAHRAAALLLFNG